MAVERIRQFIKDNFFIDQVGDDDSFLANGILDSLGVMQLVAYLESEFSVRVADVDLTPENFDSVRRVAAYVERARLAA